MKTKIIPSVLIATSLTALAPFAGAQLRVGGAAQGSVLPQPPPTLPPAPTVPAQPVTPNVSAGTAAGASSGAAGSVNSPVNRPDVGASTSTSASGQAGTSVSPGRVDVSATPRTSVDSRVNGVGATSMVTGESSASLRTTDTVRVIQSASFATRDQVNVNVQERLDATNDVVTQLRTRADAAGDKSKAAFARAMAEVRQREQVVRANLREAAHASSQNWGKVQSELAQSYSAYAQAVAEAEVAARAGK